MKRREILLIDMESFYASVEKGFHPASRGVPTVVSGDPERRSGVILAACPLAKKYGIKTAERLWEAKRKCPHLYIIKPKMQTYVDVSTHITTILQRYSDLVEPYSIDEQFVDVTYTSHLFDSLQSLAVRLQEEIKSETGVFARIGIGENKLLAKMACDHFAKKNSTGLFTIWHKDTSNTIWPLPVEALFGISSRMRTHLNNMGIRTIGQLATTPLERLKKKWGIPGHVLWESANGYDSSPVHFKSLGGEKAIGHAMTLPRDYQELSEIKVILLELCEEVALRARGKKVIGDTLKVFAKGASYDHPSSFLRQKPLLEATNYGLDLYETAVPLFNTFWDGQPIRQVGITLTNLSSAAEKQLSLFDQGWEQKERIGAAMDSIHSRYGPASLVRASSLTRAGQVFERAKKIGGHYK
ncbi:DNA polymerase IV [Alkalihalophilus pseudofirmus]|uniref:DNA polymerase IV n=1 Tax=Alkalihalophilus pseudofirmus TaxID=79885 RepID=UPI000950D011|nr:DNA polymerase IV [Alkalihalophilus pseudofirmus]